jgi:FdhD protein
VVGKGIRELGRDRADLAADAAQVVEEARPLLRQLGEDLGEPEDVYGPIIVNEVPPYSASSVEVFRLPGGATEPDEIAVEEPLEIRVSGEPVAVTMRTPGHDEELAIGFLRSEGISAVSAEPTVDLAANVIEVTTEGEVDLERLSRNFYTSSSCGVCGKGALEAVAVEAERVESDLAVPADLVSELPERLREAQPTFAATGGLHATGLFDAEGSLLCVREDVGRHNAMDKAIGWSFAAGLLPLTDKILCVSGRLSFELVQKAAVAGCPLLVAVGAPSTLAVELARDRGVTLCGFVRGGRVNVYSETQRIL